MQIQRQVSMAIQKGLIAAGCNTVGNCNVEADGIIGAQTRMACGWAATAEHRPEVSGVMHNVLCGANLWPEDQTSWREGLGKALDAYLNAEVVDADGASGGEGHEDPVS